MMGQLALGGTPTFNQFVHRLHVELETRPPIECWLWAGAKNDMGYGQVRVDGHATYTHRIAYELVHGDIPAEMELDHLCRTPLCYNPAHLQAVTHTENIRRGLRNQYAGATTCIRGHPLHGSNLRLYRRPSTGRLIRLCRACKRYHDARARPPIPERQEA